MAVPIPAHALPVIKPGATQRINFSATSTQSAAVQSEVIRIVSTAGCHVAFGPNPTATTNGMYLAPDVPEYFRVGSGTKVAVIRNTVDGSLFITEAE